MFVCAAFATGVRRSWRSNGNSTLGLAACLGALIVAAPAFAQNKRIATLAAPVAASPVAPSATSGSGRPLLAIVSIRAQTIDVYDATGAVTRSSVSSGQPGYETPTGVFSIIQKNVEHFSNLYDDAPMPFMQRLTWSGIALHAGSLPGYPASHGCIRLPHTFAERLFTMTQMGTRVIVMDGWTKPVPVAHVNLVAPVSVDPALVASRRSMAQKMANAADVMATDQQVTLRDAVSLAPDVVAIDVEDAEEPTGQYLDAARAALSARLAEATRAVAAAKIAHRRVQSETAAQVRALLTAERALQDAERRWVAAGDARAVARTEREAIRAEEAEERAEFDMAEARKTLAAIGPLATAVQARIDASAAGVQKAEQTRETIATRVRHLDRKARPISIFVSRRDRRLYVRQGFEPVGSTPIDIRDPQRPIGTHVFTAMAARFEPADATWHAVTVVDPEAAVLPRAKGRAPAITDVRPSAALAALDRIELSDDVRREIAEQVRAGSSLIISDESVSSETGKGTDFVILTR